MSKRSCATQEELSAFALGTLSDAEIERVGLHIDVCPACAAAAERLEGLTDPVLVGLRRQRLPSASATDSEQSIGRAASASVQALPDRIGDYKILRELGRGGMGIVYEAEQLSLGRRVAFKVLPRHPLPNPAAVERFRREMRAAVRLHHTNIVPVFDTGEERGLHYFTMQFISGAGLDVIVRDLKRLRATPPATAESVPLPLQSLLFGGPLTARRAEPVETAGEAGTGTPLAQPASGSDTSRPGRSYWRRIARLGIQAAEALAFAHARGVVHRDVKPSNLLLDLEGTLWVTDFGLAKAAAEPGNLTQSDEMIGTLRYTPPERFHGHTDARGDVYGLGLTLYELTTLRAAYPESDRARLLHQVMHNEPVRPRQLEPALPRDLETIILKASARDPAQRYRGAAALADDLRRFLDDRPPRARRATRLEQLWRWCRRDPVTAGLLAALVLVFLAGFLVAMSQWYRAEGKARDEAVARQAAEASEERAQANLYFSLIAQARLEWRLNNVAGAEQLLERCSPAQRGWEWHYLRGGNRAELATLDGHDNLSMVSGQSFSPDGRLLALCRYNPIPRPHDPVVPNIEVWDFRALRRLVTLDGPKYACRAAFSPDGKLLVAAGGGSPARLWEVGSWREVRSWATDNAVVFSPDGRRLAAGGGKAVTIWDTATGETLLQFPVPDRFSIALSPDDKLLAINGRNGVELRDCRTGHEVRRLESTRARSRDPYNFPEQLVFSPDGKWLATATNPVLVFEVATGQVRHRLVGHLGSVPAVAFSPDSQVLATAGADSTVHLWSAETGAEQVVLRGHHGRVSSVCFHPDGWCLASGGAQDGEVKIWDLTRPPDQHLLSGVNAQALVFDPTGMKLSSVDIRGLVHTRDVETGALVQTTAVELTQRWLTPARLAAFTGNGRLVATVSPDQRIVKVFDVAAGRQQAALEQLQAGALHLDMDRAGQRVAAAALAGPVGQRTREVRVWDAATGKTLVDYQPTPGPTPFVHGAVALSADGAYVAYDDYGSSADNVVPAHVQVCDVATGQTVRKLNAGSSVIFSLAFSPDGALVAAGDEGGHIWVWDATGQPLHHRPLEGPGWRLAFSPDGRRLAGVDREQVKVWDVATGQEFLLLRGEPPRPGDNGFNPALAWSPDGRRLAAANWTGSTSVWGAAAPTGPEELLAAAAVRAPRWHLDHAEAARDANLITFHLQRVRTATGLDRLARLRRGRLLMLAGALDAAADDFAAAFSEGLPDDLGQGLQYARLLLLRGDSAGHDRLCARLRAGLRPGVHSDTIVQVGLASALRRGSADPAEILRLSRVAQDVAPTTASTYFGIGLAHLRAGAGAEAVSWFNKAVAAGHDTAWINWPALALAHHVLGDRAEAERWLAKADNWCATAPGRTEGTTGLFLGENWLDFQILYREACALLRAKEP